jgi:hypothetical protein
VFYEKNKKSDKELEQILTSKDSYYRETVDASRERRAEFQTFFNSLKDGSDPDAQRRMKEALTGGKGDQKRLYAVDETLYGTEEGVAEKQRASEEWKRKEEERQTRRRKNNKNEKVTTHSTSSVDKQRHSSGTTIISSISQESLGMPTRWTAIVPQQITIVQRGP